MPDEPRITDHDAIIAAARQDAARAGARAVFVTVGALWRLIHHKPDVAPDELSAQV